jgi:rhodanese-related sulfurtransferase
MKFFTLKRSVEILTGGVIAAAVVWFALRKGAENAASRHDFGVVPINAWSDFSLSLSNTSNQTRTLVTATPNCNCLRILETLPISVPAKQTVKVTVRFAAEKLGQAKADLAFQWNDGEQSSHRFLGLAIPPAEAHPDKTALENARKILVDGTLISAAAAVSMAEQDRSVVDVRSSEEFELASIQGSVHSTLLRLSTWPASLKERTTLILDRGLGSEGSVQVVRRLRDQGWKKLHIIEGGLSAWVANGGAVSAQLTASSRTVSASEARERCTLPGWIIAAPEKLSNDMGLEELFGELALFSEPSSQSAQQVASLVNSRRPGQGAATSALHLLIVTEAGENASEMADAMQRLAPNVPCFILDGGLRTYLDHLRHIRPPPSRKWISLADYGAVLADLRARQQLISTCSSCSR